MLLSLRTLAALHPGGSVAAVSHTAMVRLAVIGVGARPRPEWRTASAQRLRHDLRRHRRRREPPPTPRRGMTAIIERTKQATPDVTRGVARSAVRWYGGVHQQRTDRHPTS